MVRRPGHLRGAKQNNPTELFINPYPWMSATEAKVHLELESRTVPFSWRYFNGSSPWLSMLLPSFHPEFTLKDYKIVIVVQGEFWGSLPGVLDTQALAQVLLEQDGWTFITLFAADIHTDLQGTLNRLAPALAKPSIIGTEYENPYGRPDYLEKLRSYQRSRALLLLGTKEVPSNLQGETRAVTGRRRGRSSRKRKLDIRHPLSE